MDNNDISEIENILRLKRAEEQGFDTQTIWYHVSNKNFDFFDLDKSQDGAIWLTRDLDSIKNGTTGASLNHDELFIHEFFIKTNKLGGWDEEDKYLDDQLVQLGYDGLLLDEDIKLYNPDNVRKIDYHFNKENVLNIKETINNKTIFYHGNENKEHRFSEIKPSFFTTDKKYAEGYGDYVYEYNIETKNPFDTATDEKARAFYNTQFLKDDLGKDAKYIKKGERIAENDADNFWAYLAVEVLLDKELKYDSIIVHELAGREYETSISVVPLDINQIKRKQDRKVKNKKRI